MIRDCFRCPVSTTSWYLLPLQASIFLTPRSVDRATFFVSNSGDFGASYRGHPPKQPYEIRKARSLFQGKADIQHPPKAGSLPLKATPPLMRTGGPFHLFTMIYVQRRRLSQDVTARCQESCRHTDKRRSTPAATLRQDQRDCVHVSIDEPPIHHLPQNVVLRARLTCGEALILLYLCLFPLLRLVFLSTIPSSCPCP